MIASDRRGCSGNLKREGVQEAEFRSRVYVTGFDGSLNVLKEMGLAKEMTSRGSKGRLTSGPVTS